MGVFSCWFGSSVAILVWMLFHLVAPEICQVVVGILNHLWRFSLVFLWESLQSLPVVIVLTIYLIIVDMQILSLKRRLYDNFFKWTHKAKLIQRVSSTAQTKWIRRNAECKSGEISRNFPICSVWCQLICVHFRTCLGWSWTKMFWSCLGWSRSALDGFIGQWPIGTQSPDYGSWQGKNHKFSKMLQKWGLKVYEYMIIYLGEMGLIKTILRTKFTKWMYSFCSHTSAEGGANAPEKLGPPTIYWKRTEPGTPTGGTEASPPHRASLFATTFSVTWGDCRTSLGIFLFFWSSPTESTLSSCKGTVSS